MYVVMVVIMYIVWVCIFSDLLDNSLGELYCNLMNFFVTLEENSISWRIH